MHAHKHAYIVHTDRGKGQTCFTKIFGEEKHLEFAIERVTDNMDWVILQNLAVFPFSVVQYIIVSYGLHNDLIFKFFILPNRGFQAANHLSSFSQSECQK